jgi:hypothetical protein
MNSKTTFLLAAAIAAAALTALGPFLATPVSAQIFGGSADGGAGGLAFNLASPGANAEANGGFGGDASARACAFTTFC